MSCSRGLFFRIAQAEMNRCFVPAAVNDGKTLSEEAEGVAIPERGSCPEFEPTHVTPRTLGTSDLLPDESNTRQEIVSFLVQS